MKNIAMVICSLIVAGCASAPAGVKVVDGFELQRYLGSWYEIARLDHRFERGLSRVSATYSMRNDGGVEVINRGYNRSDNSWKEARGRAYLRGKPQIAALKVSFFWPFYAGYNVIALDRQDYRYALVCGPSRDYLWILAREQQLEAPVVERLVAMAGAYGFDTEALIFVEQGE